MNFVGECGCPHNKELHDLPRLSAIVAVVKSRKKRSGHLACVKIPEMHE
jgi:hypothetical protein